MTIYNLGSINIDNFYAVSHMPLPGETLAADEFSVGLGGKGANQSVAAARAGANVHHIGAVSAQGLWCVKRLAEAGVVTDAIETDASATGHANICIDRNGENMIVLFPGANAELTIGQVEIALFSAGPNDTLILQNETNLTAEAAALAKSKGMRVIYSAAPFSAPAVTKMLPLIDLLVVNEVEAAQLSQALHLPLEQIDVPNMLITRGAEGAVWRDLQNANDVEMPAFQVKAVDTTGAGDCFIGYVAAALDQGLSVPDALRLASAASALQVMQHGTADAMPARDRVDAFLAERAAS